MGGRVFLADVFAAAGAEIAFHAGRVQEALELARGAASDAEATGSLLAAGLAHRFVGQALAAGAPDSDEAVQHLDRSLHLLECGGARLEAAHTRLALALLCRVRGEAAPAREHFAAALAQLEQSGLDAESQRVRALAGESD
jgi:hypothetical protein